MTPEQRSALEGLVGKPLTPDQLTRVEAYLPERNDVEIAKIISEGKVRIVSKRVGVGTILEKFNGKGGEFLDALASIGQSNRDIHWLLESNIKRGDFDVGVPASRVGMQNLALMLPEYAEGIGNLLAAAEEPELINFNKVSDVLNIAEGRMTLNG